MDFLNWLICYYTQKDRLAAHKKHTFASLHSGDESLLSTYMRLLGVNNGPFAECTADTPLAEVTAQAGRAVTVCAGLLGNLESARSAGPLGAPDTNGEGTDVAGSLVCGLTAERGLCSMRRPEVVG